MPLLSAGSGFESPEGRRLSRAVCMFSKCLCGFSGLLRQSKHVHFGGKVNRPTVKLCLAVNGGWRLSHAVTGLGDNMDRI